MPAAGQKTSDEHRLTVWFGTVEKKPLLKIYASNDNRIAIDADLLIGLANQLDGLRAYLKLERQAEEILHVRAQRTAEMDVHTND